MIIQVIPIPEYGFAVFNNETLSFETVLGQQVWETSSEMARSFEMEQNRYPTVWRFALGQELVMMAREAGF